MSDLLFAAHLVLLAVLGFLIVQSASWRATPFAFAMLQLSPVVLGYVRLDQGTGDFTPTLWFDIMVIAVTAAYCAVKRRESHLQIAQPRPETAGALATTPALAVVSTVTALTIYHFAVGGVPLFAANVESARFQFTASGLAGVPSRAFLFGNALALAAAVYVWRRNGRYGTLLLVVSLTTLVGSRAIAGFKGGLLEALSDTAVIFALVQRGLRFRTLSWRYPVAVAACALFAVLIAGLYSTYSETGASATSALIDRATTAAATPGHRVVASRDPLQFSDENSLTNDIVVYLGHYTPLPVGAGGYSFQQQVASTLYGIPVSAISGPVPVTVTAFGQLYYDFGALAIFPSMLIGVGFALIERRAAGARSEIQFAAFAAMALILLTYLNAGDIVYLLLNWGATWSLLGIIALGARATTSRSANVRAQLEHAISR